VNSLDRFFTPEQVERSRRYHRPRYVARGLDLALGLLTLGLLSAFVDWKIGPWWLAAPLLAVIALALTALAQLPVSFWSSFLNERHWGFSTQSLRGWIADIFRKVLVGCIFTAVPVFGLVGLARAFPSWWPAVAAPLAALFVLVIGFVAPVVL
jgi:hypothetical protein